MEVLGIAFLGILVVYVFSPLLIAIISLISFYLTLRNQLKQFFLNILIENDFPKTFPENGDPDKWLTQMKFDNSLSFEKRIMGSELLLTISMFVNSNLGLPQCSRKIFAVFEEAILQYQKYK